MKVMRAPGLAIALALLTGGAQAAAPGDAGVAARTLLRELVAIRSAKGHGQVPKVAELLAERFRRAGFAEDDIRILRTNRDDGEPIAALS